MLKLKPFDSKSKGLLGGQPDTWVIDNGWRANIPGKTLVCNVTTGYLAWWPNDHIFEMDKVT